MLGLQTGAPGNRGVWVHAWSKAHCGLTLAFSSELCRPYPSGKVNETCVRSFTRSAQSLQSVGVGRCSKGSTGPYRVFPINHKIIRAAAETVQYSWPGVSHGGGRHGDPPASPACFTRLDPSK